MQPLNHTVIVYTPNYTVCFKKLVAVKTTVILLGGVFGKYLYLY